MTRTVRMQEDIKVTSGSWKADAHGATDLVYPGK